MDEEPSKTQIIAIILDDETDSIRIDSDFDDATTLWWLVRAQQVMLEDDDEEEEDA